MSKTLKTRPISVRMADKGDKGVGIQEVHDHRDGKVCDLPEMTDTKVYQHNVTFLSGNCHYQWEYVGVNVCACNVCSDPRGRRNSVRHNRQEARKKIRAIVQGDDADDYVFADNYNKW